MIPHMGRMCGLCQGSASRDSCFVRLDNGEEPACRPCWEQLFLDPRRFLRSLKSASTERHTPPHPTSN